MNNIIDNEIEIRELLNKSLAKTIEANYCEDFNEYISNNYIWLPTRISWSENKIKYEELKWRERSLFDIKKYFDTSCVGRFELLSVIYSADEPGLIMRYEDLINNLENVSYEYGFKYGVHFIVGSSINQYGVIKLHNEYFIEADHSYLRAPIIEPK
jgi:hypothetical protein